ncbi:MAG: ATP-binding cassette domain-containing protein [Bacteroidia bacterium]|nr:ATP-binding cassette domain-containing protein [Bacteroidia bacterium]MCX7652546.1 ATP-binding cassette domain-containing protein [Bacteroidia bacterium]MDW8417529.1 ATP-binding cassette domain-containing protein [Bacteroidia bacterium]
MSPVLLMRNVSLAYGDRLILKGVSLSLNKGDFIYLTGRTGSGKTSLLRAIYADIRPVQGEIWVGETRVDTLSQSEIPFLRRKLGIVFQDFQLLPYRTVYQNVALTLEVTGWRDKKRIREQVMDTLLRVGLSARKDAYPHELSGGEQQRTCIARALVGSPILILADEPTGNLDPEVGTQILNLFHQIARWGTAVILATHNPKHIQDMPASTYICKDGSLQPIATLVS